MIQARLKNETQNTTWLVTSLVASLCLKLDLLFCINASLKSLSWNEQKPSDQDHYNITVAVK